MPTPTEAATRGLLQIALDGAVLRHQAIAANIAQAGQPQAATLRVDFEDRLRLARERAAAGEPWAKVAPDAQPVLSADSPSGERSGIALDAQAADLARNVLQYQALLRGLSRRQSFMALVLADGRR